MSIFDLISKATSSAVMGQAQAIAGMVTPVELDNLEKSHTILEERITQQEQQPVPTELAQLRTFLMSYAGHLRDGGEPKPDALQAARVQADPRFASLRDRFQTLHLRVAALEYQYLGCTYGFQMSDGSIVVPSANWTEEEFLQVQAQAVQQTARCWLDSDRSQFV